MFLKSLPQIEAYIDHVSNLLSVHNGEGLTKGQKVWFSLVIVGIFVTGKLCWAAFERVDCFGQITQDRLRWFFNYAEIPWNYLLSMSVKVLIKKYDIKEGVLVLDDSDKNRSKITKKIYGAHKIKDKKSGGFINAQELIFLVLVTPEITLPVGVKFYRPDPEIKKWRVNDKRLRKQGVAAKARPAKPESNEDYPSKSDLAIELIREFTQQLPNINVKSVLADALYGSKKFLGKVSNIAGIPQVISQLKKNQKVLSSGKWISLDKYFNRQPGVRQAIKIRGGENKHVTMLAARLKVKAHGEKRFVIALKYDGEDEYRFLVATNMSWRHQDIAKCYTLRWLVEVFIEDWKQHGGWNKMAKHQGEEGSRRGLILSLMCDHFLLFHDEQFAFIKNEQFSRTAGTTIEQIKVDATIGTMQEVINSDSPVETLEAIKTILTNRIELRKSTKHMIGRDLGYQQEQPSLKYRKTG